MKRADLFKISSWKDLEHQYYGQLTFTNSGEALEEYGAKKHRLHERMPYMEKFWRCHVAPSTNRPDDTYFADNIDPYMSLIAERSYEVYCNIVDAMDELDASQHNEPPRQYRNYLNVLRLAGDALQLFNELRRVNQKILSKDTHQKIELFPDWEEEHWGPKQKELKIFRDMLVHHGRPWFFFKTTGAKSVPYIFRRAHYQTGRDTYKTWLKQIRARKQFEQHPSRFIALCEAAKDTIDDTVEWLNKGYERTVSKMEPLLDDPKYRKRWGWP